MEGFTPQGLFMSRQNWLLIHPIVVQLFLIWSKVLNRWTDKLEPPLPTQSHETPCMSKWLPISLFSHGIKTHQRTVNTEQIKCGVIVRHHYVSFGCKISPGFEDAVTRNAVLPVQTPPAAHFTVRCGDLGLSDALAVAVTTIRSLSVVLRGPFSPLIGGRVHTLKTARKQTLTQLLRPADAALTK